MNKMRQDFLCLLRKTLINDEGKIDVESFSLLEKYSINHMSLALVCDGTLKMGLNPPESWKQYSYGQVVHNCNNLSVQQKILNILQENDIRCVVLKGISVSIYYPNPLQRLLGDIDILVDEENYDKAINLLTGSTKRESEYLKHKFHYHFLYDNVMVEIHKFMTEYTDDEYGRFLKEHLKNALDDIAIKQYKCYSFPALNSEYQTISLLLHTQRHFFEHKTNLRMICDYAMYIQILTKEEWNKIYPTLEKLRLNIFADALIWMCQKYLGISVNWEIKSKVSEEIIENLIDEFSNDGQSPEFIGDLNNISLWKKLKSIFATIHSVVKNEFNILNQAPILYPLFWGYVPLRTILRKIKGNEKTVQVMDYSIAIERRKKICKQLNLKD